MPGFYMLSGNPLSGPASILTLSHLPGSLVKCLNCSKRHTDSYLANHKLVYKMGLESALGG